MSERIRAVSMRAARDDKRGGFPMLNARGPLLSFEEVAQIIGTSSKAVQRAEQCAFTKMRAALSAWGYNKERA